MQEMLAGKRSRGKPRQRWEKDITDIFGTTATASRVAEGGQELLSQRPFGSDVLKRIWLRLTKSGPVAKQIYFAWSINTKKNYVD